MKKILLLAGLLFALAACKKEEVSSELNDETVSQLSGKWKQLDGDDEIEFISEGSLKVKSDKTTQNGLYFYKIDGKKIHTGWMLSCVAADFSYNFEYNSKKKTFIVDNFYNRGGATKLTFYKAE